MNDVYVFTVCVAVEGEGAAAACAGREDGGAESLSGDATAQDAGEGPRWPVQEGQMLHNHDSCHNYSVRTTQMKIILL